VKLPGALLLPAGFAVMSIVTQFAHMSDTTAGLSTPVAVSLAVAGFGLSFPWRRRKLNGWLISVGAGVYAVFGAPVVLSGRASFAGYIKLDDTANYMAMLDRAMQHGYNVVGLAPSTYEAFLSSIYVYGYPLGSLLPLGVGQTLVRQDALWLWQPYLTVLAVLLAVGLYEVVSGLVKSAALRALVAFVGAQAALLYGYALWGGIKELATSAVVVLIAALVPTTARQKNVRGVLPLAVAVASLFGVLSLAGAAWLGLPLAGALILSSLAGGISRAVRMSGAFLLCTAFLASPSIAAALKWLPNAGGYTSGGEYANLLHRLSWLQIFGIWPNGDFRSSPRSLDVTHVLVAVVGVAAAAALVMAWRKKAFELVLAVGAALVACAIYVEKGSPWIGGKTLASASPIILTAAIAGAAAVFESRRRTEGTVMAAVMIAGVLWSNALQYHAVNLAPAGRLAELATIGHRFAGQGPTLMTEYEAYGTRHFLRNMETEGASELRRRFDYLRAGGVADPGVSVDVDEIQLDSVLTYRTLVLRRSGVASRPPSVYAPVWSGRYYDVWQRPESPSPILEHLSLGSRLQPAAIAPCNSVLRLAGLAAASHGVLAAVKRDPAILIEPSGKLGVPRAFGRYGEDPEAVYLTRSATIQANFATSAAGRYGVWVSGTFRSRVDVSVDGRPVGRQRDQLNWPSTFTSLGSARLRPGTHHLVLRYRGPDLGPGSGGTPPFGLGPIAVAQGTADRPVTYVKPQDAHLLCGKNLDWIEALRG
jgi:hypothetical protein